MATKSAPPRGRGRPKKFEAGERTRLTLVLRRDQVVALERAKADIREATGAVLSLSDLARAIVDAVLESGIDLKLAESEEEVRGLIAARMKRR
jgi:transposase